MPGVCHAPPSYFTLTDSRIAYHFPNDPTESERLDEQYEVIKMAMDGHLHLCPFSRQQPPRRVLDIATGTGTWAIEIGDQYPEAQIIGTDLSPIQPPFVPPNVRFFVEDSYVSPYLYSSTHTGRTNMGFTGQRIGIHSFRNTRVIFLILMLILPRDYPELFDFIHTRVTIGCWTDMQRQIIQRAYDHLQPGGWLECQEIPAIPSCDDGTMAPDNPFLLWSTDIAEASERANRPANVGAQLKDWLREVGFVDVQETVFKLPVGGWPKEIRLKHIGMLWQRNLLEGLSGLTLRLFHHFLGRSVGEIEVSYCTLRIVRGDVDIVTALPSKRSKKPLRPKSPRLSQTLRRVGPETRDRMTYTPQGNHLSQPRLHT